MRFVHGVALAVLVALAGIAASGSAATIPFTEEFSANDSNWRANDNIPGSLTWKATGGADGGGYVSTTFNFVSSTPGAQGPVLFRGHGSADASGDAFVGNWLTEGVDEFSIWVRTDSTVPVNFFARFASPQAFPGAIAVAFTSVASSGDWTKLVFAIDPSNPQFVSFEGSSFNAVFGNIGNVQVGVSIPTVLAGVDQVVRFDLDGVGIVPEPPALTLVLATVAALAVRRVRSA